jgi:hypothetical protein
LPSLEALTGGVHGQSGKVKWYVSCFTVEGGKYLPIYLFLSFHIKLIYFCENRQVFESPAEPIR